MKCPHCLIDYHEQIETKDLPSDKRGEWYVTTTLCPACNSQTIKLTNREFIQAQFHGHFKTTEYLVHPKGIARAPIPAEVPPSISNDYLEACLVLSDSPKASAALSRRCLQNLLLDKAGVRKGDLSNQIQQVLDSGKLPSHLEENIDAIRNIGNFAAHPNKSKSTGEILEVEPHEAEWNLDVLEDLFDYYYVQPEKARARKAALDAKLADSGKPPMK